jgi:subtilisin family serine protease
MTSRNGGPADTDPNGHGTHLAGIVAATAGNGRGGSGIAPGVRILPVRVLDAQGAGYSSHVAAGIVWATDNGAAVINLSLGGPIASGAQQEAIAYAVSRGVLVVGAAGNNHGTGGVDVAQYPAAFADVLAVAAVTPESQPATFSTRGDYVDLAAPGTMITSTYPGDRYASFSGTSMAAPFVAGAAALLEGLRDMTPAQLSDVLRASAVDVAQAGADPATGAGLVSLPRAVDAVAGPSAPAAPRAAAPAPVPQAAHRVAATVRWVRRGRPAHLRIPGVQGESYAWFVRRPRGQWRPVPAAYAPVLRTARATSRMDRTRYKLVAAGQPSKYGVVILRVLPGTQR